MIEQTQTSKRITPIKGVQIIVDHEFVGDKSISDAFIPIIFDDIRKVAELNRTLDNDKYI